MGKEIETETGGGCVSPAVERKRHRARTAVSGPRSVCIHRLFCHQLHMEKSEGTHVHFHSIGREPASSPAGCYSVGNRSQARSHKSDQVAQNRRRCACPTHLRLRSLGGCGFLAAERSPTPSWNILGRTCHARLPTSLARRGRSRAWKSVQPHLKPLITSSACEDPIRR